MSCEICYRSTRHGVDIARSAIAIYYWLCQVVLHKVAEGGCYVAVDRNRKADRYDDVNFSLIFLSFPL